MPFYGVWKGNKTGVFDNWNDCQNQIKGFKGALFKKLVAKNKADAETEFKKGYNGNANKNKGDSASKNKINNYHLKPGIHVFLDGACPKNKKPSKSASGCAVFFNGVLKKLYCGSFTEQGSNNVAELSAALFYLKKIKEINQPVNLYIDSQYTIDCIQTWAAGWAKKGWKKSDGKTPIENKELVIECFKAYKQVEKITTIIKVKAHIGELGNELADRMAIKAVLDKQEEWTSYDNTNDIESLLKISYK